MGQVKVGIVGAGYWGKNLVRNFESLGALSLICDTQKETLNNFSKQYQHVSVTESFQAVLEDNVLTAVAIATPAETHYPLVKETLLANKHVFVEKPLSLTVAEGQELVELAQQKQLILMVGHILQYHPAVIELKKLVDRGELGKIQYLYSNRLNIGKIRAEENILWSFAPHDISVILMLLEEMPETVCASGGSYLQHQIPDTTLTTLDFSSGVKAHIFVSWLHPFKEQKLVVVGDRKMAVFDDVSQEKLQLYPHKIEWLQRIPVAAKAEAELVPIKKDEPLRAECQHFLDCVANGHTPKTDGREGSRVLQVLQASQESLNQKGRKINIDSYFIASGRADEPRAQDYFVHESSYIDDDVEIGAGTKIWHFSHVLRGSKIGMQCNIGQNVVIGPDVKIGNQCKIQNNVSVYKGVTLEDGVFCGPSMVFTNIYNPRAEIRKMDQVRSTLVKKGVTIGANATVICGITLGRYSFIGAGSLVNKNVPDYALVVGNPVKQIGWACECGERLPDDLECISCGKHYVKKEDGLALVIKNE